MRLPLFQIAILSKSKLIFFNTACTAFHACEGAIFLELMQKSVLLPYESQHTMSDISIQSLAIAVSPLPTAATSFTPASGQGCAVLPTLLGNVFGRAYN